MLLALGTGIPALVMARNDLAQMRTGAVDERGRYQTEWGRNKAIIGIVIGVPLRPVLAADPV